MTSDAANTRIDTRSPGHIEFLDHFRGLAILLVFGFHTFTSADSLHSSVNPELSKSIPMSHLATLVMGPFSQGWIGVPIFFIVSGFCIHLSHVKSRERGFKTFFTRRFFRIYPPYIIALLFFFVTQLGVYSPTGISDLTAHLLLLHNFSTWSLYSINGAFWSIAVEVQLYLLYPLVFWFARKRGWLQCMIILCFIEVGINFLTTVLPHLPPQFTTWLQWTEFSPFRYWFSWTIGAVIADDWMAGRPIFMSRCALWLWPAVLIGCFVTGLHYFRFTFAALSTAAIVSRLLINPGAVSRLLTEPFHRLFRWVGMISYSAYLIHQPLISFASRLIRQLFPSLTMAPLADFLLLVVLVWPLILLVSWGFYLWVELPSIALGKWVLRQGALPNIGHEDKRRARSETSGEAEGLGS